MIKFGRPVAPDVENRLPLLVHALARDGRIEAIWLFGSRARGDADALSDVDVAVLARRELDAAALWDAQIDWTNLAVEALGTEEVAVQPINRLATAVRYGILRHARLLWASLPEAAADVTERTLKEYLDLKPYLERYDRDLFRQALTGRLR